MARRDLVVTAAVGVALLASELLGAWLQDGANNGREDERAATAQRLEDERALQAERLEDLRFVRDRSSADPALPRPFNSVDLVRMNLSGLQLQNAQFPFAKLAGVFLIGTDLSSVDNLATETPERTTFLYADLTGANLTGADLSGADLSGADLSGAILNGAGLSGAGLSGAYLGGADLSGADLSGAGLSDATLVNVCYDDQTVWPQDFQPPLPDCFVSGE